MNKSSRQKGSKMKLVTKTKRTEIGQKGAGMGDEPVISNQSSRLDMIRAYNWYNYFYNDDDAKNFVVNYCKTAFDKTFASDVSNIPAHELHNIGWNCRILSNGGSLPEDIANSTQSRLRGLVAKYAQEASRKTATSIGVNVIDYTIAKAKRYIAELDEHLDKFYNNQEYTFNVSEWCVQNSINQKLAQIISQHYADLLNEISMCHSQDNREAYDHIDSVYKKKYVAFLKNIVGIGEGQVLISPGRKSRKQRAAKLKKVNTSKNKYHPNSPRRPADILTKRLVFIYNEKYNRLHCFKASGSSGLTIKGASIFGYDEKSSLSVRLGRNPKPILSKIMAAQFPEKVFDSITTKKKIAKPRLTEHVMIIKCQ